ncbi:hypothetical protein GOP47_0027539 [Adiantum capillus-veneris]|nr:hypothetical protein GOP47_0027539 [Adiantum capillus-veneris]
MRSGTDPAAVQRVQGTYGSEECKYQRIQGLSFAIPIFSLPIVNCLVKESQGLLTKSTPLSTIAGAVCCEFVVRRRHGASCIESSKAVMNGPPFSKNLVKEIAVSVVGLTICYGESTGET